MKIGPQYSSKQFNYEPTTRTFSTFASDLASNKFMGALYDDACDFGLWMKSEKTGKMVAFLFEDSVADDEGDTMFWTLRSWDLKDEANGLLLKVFND